jgi:hypothetical protein
MREGGLDMRQHGFRRYCERKPDVADWTCGTHNVILDTSTDSLQTNGMLKAECSLR